jgi:hypothetical protein
MVFNAYRYSHPANPHKKTNVNATAKPSKANPARQANPASKAKPSKQKTIGKASPWCQTPKKAKQAQQGQALKSKKAPKGLFSDVELRYIPDQIVF